MYTKEEKKHEREKEVERVLQRSGGRKQSHFPPPTLVLDQDRESTHDAAQVDCETTVERLLRDVTFREERRNPSSDEADTVRQARVQSNGKVSCVRDRSEARDGVPYEA